MEMERVGKENAENYNPITEVLTVKQLEQKVYSKAGVVDERFRSVEQGGVFKYFDVEDLASPFYTTDTFFPVVLDHDTVVGLAKLQEDPARENNLWLQFVAIDPHYQGRGYATKLLEKIFAFASEEKCSLTVSMYSLDGQEKLKPVIERLAQEYEVTLVK